MAAVLLAMGLIFFKQFELVLQAEKMVTKTMIYIIYLGSLNRLTNRSKEQMGSYKFK